MLADKIKQDTLACHQQLEKKLVAQIKAIKTGADYVNMLQLFYGYFGGLEDRINQFVNTALLPDYEERRKTEAIANDIKTFGAVPVQKATISYLPAITNTAQAMGALYVIEGSTLGGSIISKMISAKLGISTGLSFFNGYAENSHKMWSIFQGLLNQQPQADSALIIEAANSTFLQFKNWIELYS